MNNPKAGDLIYVPSEVLLYTTESDASSEVNEWRKTSKPGHLLVADVKKTTYVVFYENKYWLVDKDKVYGT